ncbi:GMP synthase (glutamine-hydrolyzing) [Coxiella burnetii]|uniref:GMP synthase [glutamine-hydrolyzing] n=1 Tax=Coxiella burnetii (strain Dugway 5J108-111) TaxID=434922 RepID=GUAA_COXBN|nr:glutamine-hydrolyzing GMP synthase [Coxiella burnetii]A9KGD5.1 RecName: Full=GMP synthase [glutamine-hydrolyzing]; AltName: Full=GMP synthetase; AltName: Full=Glutamine amidotransferase [Coxiella burnetii Dugway 5J108-111]ABS77340.1 GMP synthase (glutamine-hydrolyzing) [Coxiella burnetii Dugway 5J108-111]OYK79744.1 GMP synthase (glutamine-hydrolyzing) [Coxiella burnetii]OYK81827.1 GMP synthase (glutamine-hydrolyzing) [Coxiella burnetii]
MLKDIHQHRILILDFSSQYAQLIARRVREIGVYCELMPCDIDEETIRDFNPHGIILSGGPETVTLSHTLRAPAFIFEIGCPVLGICYGMQTMAYQLGGKVNRTAKAEFGHAQLRVLNPAFLFDGIEDQVSPQGEPLLDVWMSHGDIVSELPPGFEATACTDNSPLAAMADFKRRFFGLQFHPEVTHTPQGHRILAHFVIHICQCIPNWTTKHIIEDSIRDIQEKVGKEQVIVGLSGGVDSAVTATLVHKAIGDQLVCVLVDTGLLRLNEVDEVLNVFQKHLGAKVICVDAKDRFMKALKGISDPEEKRKIAGEQFIRVFEEQAKKLNVKWLGQGTIYPDVIESAKTKTGKGHIIKTHHNVGGLPLNMELKLIEPLRELFKDEVRKLGLELGLPADLIYRHPFPGPGLAIRILGEVNAEYINILKQADAIFIEELKKSDYYHQVSQAFAVFMPLKSVGVKGDARHYGYIIALRAVKTVDFMTAQWADLPHEFLSKVSHRIVNEIKEVSRVVYDMTNKPPATIEWE